VEVGCLDRYLMYNLLIFLEQTTIGALSIRIFGEVIGICFEETDVPYRHLILPVHSIELLPGLTYCSFEIHIIQSHEK
jgi:hypothetical protein